MSAFRRVKGTFSNAERAQQTLIDSGLLQELVGAALDHGNFIIYLQSFHQKPWTFWNRYKWIQNLEPWESREPIKVFAERSGFQFLAGDQYQDATEKVKKGKVDTEQTDSLEDLKRKIGYGAMVDDLETDAFIIQDFKALDVIAVNRDELVQFEKTVKRIKMKLKEDMRKEKLYPHDEEEEYPSKRRKLNNGESQAALVLTAEAPKTSKFEKLKNLKKIWLV